MDFIFVLRFLVEELGSRGIDFALMGGLALHSAGVVRATEDIDLLVLAEKAGPIKELMLRKGYSLLHESADVMNFAGGTRELGRVDFLLARRKYTLRMLKDALEKPLLEGQVKVKVLRAEDLIGLKVQSSSNDRERYHQDMADIRELLRNNLTRLDVNVVREYFALFKRECELDEILKDCGHAQ